MKVKKLIEMLLEMPQEADIKINLRQSENMIDINTVKKYKSGVVGYKPTESVEIIADWRDFFLDEEEDFFCKEELEEEQKPEYDEMDEADQKYDEMQDSQASR